MAITDSGSVISPGPGVASTATGTLSIDDNRRMFNFGERIAELAPVQSPFFTYLSKVAKKPTDDPVFKFLERRHQWQRRTFQVAVEMPSAAHSASDANWNLTNLRMDCLYDTYGRTVTTAVRPEFLLESQIVAIEAEYDDNGADAGVGSETACMSYWKVGTPDLTNSAYAEIDLTFIKAYYVPDGTNAGEIAEATSSKLRLRENANGQVVGSAFAEGTTDPKGWRDEFYDREGYCQIFKTAIPMFSGTAMATRYRGVANEYKRVWQEKLMEHKMDLEHAMLFGIGSADESAAAGTGPLRRTWGIVPYTEAYGKIKTFTYAASSYDSFLDAMEDVFSPESGNSGNKLVLAGRKIISWLNKLAVGDSFFGNTGALGHKVTTEGGSNVYGLDLQNIKGSYGHNVTTVNTVYGNLHFVQEPLFRGGWEDYACMIDLKNVAYRPLSSNGISRDTHIITNVQNNNEDGRKDICLTEAGLEVSLPETHCILKFA